MIIEFIKYSLEEVLKIFDDGLSNLSASVPDTFKEQFSDEILKNVFND